MIPDPLHPAVVHLPIALAILIPVLAVLGTVLIHKRYFAPETWMVVVFLQALLVASSWLAIETGEEQEDRVERVVAERHIERHEAAAERFTVLAGISLLAGAAGLLPARLGRIGRSVGALATLGVLAAGISVGHSGGELVYKHGAASAFAETTSGGHLPSRTIDDD